MTVRTEPTIPIIPDHEVLRVIGRGAYGEIWLARSLTGTLRAVKVVHRNTFESERAFEREFQGMCSFEPVSRGHEGFVDILHVGQTGAYLYYIMELADDHIAGREIDVLHYEPRTLKSEVDRHRRLSADESVRLGLCLTGRARNSARARPGPPRRETGEHHLRRGSSEACRHRPRRAERATLVCRHRRLRAAGRAWQSAGRHLQPRQGPLRDQHGEGSPRFSRASIPASASSPTRSVYCN